MNKHLACSLGHDYFVEVQGTTPMTKHILSISGVQIAPKCFKFIPGPNTKYVDHVWVIKKTKHNSSPPNKHSVIRSKMFGDGHAYPIYMQLKQAKENKCSSDNGYEHEES
jgi:hypothetical protein